MQRRQISPPIIIYYHYYKHIITLTYHPVEGKMKLSIPSVTIAAICSHLLVTAPYSAVAFTPGYQSKTTTTTTTTSSTIQSSLFPQSTQLVVNNVGSSEYLSFDPSKAADSIEITPNEYGSASAKQTAMRAYSSVLTSEPFYPNSGVHHWVVRVDKCIQREDVILGVATSKAHVKSFIGAGLTSWGLTCGKNLWHGKVKVKTNYGTGFGAGSVVVLSLDTNAGTLSYGVLPNSAQFTNGDVASAVKNAQDWGVAFEGLPRDTALFPAVTLYQRDDMVTLFSVAENRPKVEVVSSSIVDASSSSASSKISASRLRELELQAEQKIASQFSQIEAAAEAMITDIDFVQEAIDTSAVDIENASEFHRSEEVEQQLFKAFVKINKSESFLFKTPSVVSINHK